MRNDQHDDPIDIPSLTIDTDDPLEQRYFDTHSNKAETTADVNQGLKKSWGYIFLLLFILYTAAMVGLFWLGKQAADSVQSQLEEKTNSASLVTQTTAGQLQRIVDELNNQQSLTKASLENLRAQNKQLANKLVELSTMQQKISTKQQETDKQLNELQNKLASLTTTVVSNDKTNQLNELSNEISIVKKAQISEDNIKRLRAEIELLKNQNLPQVVKSIQDDLSSLRGQLGISTNQYVGNLLEEIQTKLQTLQKQVDNRSPY